METVLISKHSNFKRKLSFLILTTICRVVFDGSMVTDTGIYLNEILMIGPTIQDALINILIRFRPHPIALIADIEKMYRQFWIHPDDRKFQ